MHKVRAVLAIAVTVGVSAAPAGAQYTNPYTGNTFNNPMSSFMDTVILHERNASMLRNSLNSSMIASLAAERARIQKFGAETIRKGKATTRFSPVKPFDREAWITRCGGRTPELRRQLGEELKVQRTLWTDEARARGADASDVAQMMGVAFTLSWEPHSGGKANAAQYRSIVEDFRKSLLKDPYFQGMSAEQKQYLVESNLINSSDAVRQWRQGRTAGDATTEGKGQTAATRFLDQWWQGGTANLMATPTGFTDRKPAPR